MSRIRVIVWMLLLVVYYTAAFPALFGDMVDDFSSRNHAVSREDASRRHKDSFSAQTGAVPEIATRSNRSNATTVSRNSTLQVLPNASKHENSIEYQLTASSESRRIKQETLDTSQAKAASEQAPKAQVLPEKKNLMETVSKDAQTTTLPESAKEEEMKEDTGQGADMTSLTEEVSGNDEAEEEGVAEHNDPPVPKFMVDLYERFSAEKYSHPMANIVRSFTRISIARDNVSYAPNITEDLDDPPGEEDLVQSCRSAENGRSRVLRTHRMTFNVTSVGRDEDIYLAELRLYRLIDVEALPPVADESFFHRVTVVELLGHDAEGPPVGETGRCADYDLICSKEIVERADGWETLTVTDEARRWIRQSATTHTLEVRIEAISRRDDPLADSEFGYDFIDFLDFETHAQNDHEPLLLVFSNDHRHRQSLSRDLVDVIAHEADVLSKVMDLEDDEDDSYMDEHEEEVEKPERKIVKRSIQPLSPQVVVRGQGYQLAGVEESAEHAMNRTVDGDDAERNYTERAMRVRRTHKSRSKKNICRRKKMYVNFKDINWEEWIIEPKGYQAYECTGRCYYPLSDHLTPTKHAIIQTTLNAVHKKKASPVCCVPTRLDPISILYIDEKDVVTYKYKYEGMVVAECGCR